MPNTVDHEWCRCIHHVQCRFTPFTGDMIFQNCMFPVESSGNNSTIWYCFPDSGASCAGMRWDNCLFMHSDYGVRMDMGAGAGIADTWFTNCHFDGIGRCHQRQLRTWS